MHICAYIYIYTPGLHCSIKDDDVDAGMDLGTNCTARRRLSRSMHDAAGAEAAGRKQRAA